MTVENASVIDGLAIDPNTDEVVLLISDHLDWTDEAQHFDCIERKIGLYLHARDSGQLLSIMPAAAGKSVRIEIIQQFEPSPRAHEFLEAAKAQLAEMGIRLSSRVLSEGN